MIRDSEPTQLDAWEQVDIGDEPHEVLSVDRSPGETEGARIRFPIATQRDRGLDVERFADGSTVGLLQVRAAAPVAVEVRLRPSPPPSADELDAVRRWLRKQRAAAGRPMPLPAPPVPPPVVDLPQQLQPVHRPEPTRGSYWPLAAVSLGLMAALVATFIS